MSYGSFILTYFPIPLFNLLPNTPSSFTDLSFHPTPFPQVELLKTLFGTVDKKKLTVKESEIWSKEIEDVGGSVIKTVEEKQYRLHKQRKTHRGDIDGIRLESGEKSF